MKLAAVVVLALVCVPLAACGDEEQKVLSKSEYVKQGTAICAEHQAALDQLTETEFPVTRSALAPLFAKAVPIFEKEVSDLRALDGPAADQAKVDGMLAAGDRLVAEVARASKDPELAAKFFNEGGGESQAAFDQQTNAVGLKCDQDEAPPKRLDPATFSDEKRAYVKQADAVCRASNRETSALGERLNESGFPPELASWAKFVPRISKVNRANLSAIKRLTPPAADEATIDALIARQEKVNDQRDEAGKLAASGDEPGFTALAQDGLATVAEIDEDLRAYGFQVCGSEE